MMNKKITFSLLGIMALFLGRVNAQNYQTLNVTSGYNEDLIANGTGTAASSTTQSVDDPTNGYVFMSTDFVNGSGETPTSGLPGNGLINSINTPGLTFQLASYTANNSLRLLNEGDSGTLSFNSTPKASKLYLLATTGSGISEAKITVNFTDGTTQVFTNNIINDWYGGTSFAINGIGRVSRVNDAIENSADNPRLYEIALSISAANQSKNISSVNIAKTSSWSGIVCVFGLSYIVANSCIAPDGVSFSNISSNSATVSWNAITGSSSYEIYQSTNSTVPVSATVPTITGISGTSKDISGLSPATSYYIWVRSNCGGGNTSDWSQVVNFTTSCAAVNIPYTEDFNAAADYSIPDCTSTQVIAGDNWYVADFAGAVAGFNSKGLYTTTYGLTSMNSWFYTQGVNLQAGTNYTFSFQYGNYLGALSLKVAYGSSPAETSMTNIIVDYPDVNVTSATPATFTITPAVTGTYYFGFNNYTSAGTMGMLLLDDISVTAASLGTQESLSQNNNAGVYPNPVSDYLYIRGKQKNTEVKIFDTSGKMVSVLNNVDQKIDVSRLIKGTYVVVIKNADGALSNYKFIKK